MGVTSDDVRALLQAFEASTWQEMIVEVGGDRIHVSRCAVVEPGSPPAAVSNGQVPAPAPAPVPAPAAASVSVGAGAPAAVAEARDVEPAAPAGGTPAVSPSVGLFWRAPSPDAPPFVEVGSRVAPEDTIGIVEVMKLMTPVPAGRAGTVTAILVENGGMVEHGQPLVLIGG